MRAESSEILPNNFCYTRRTIFASLFQNLNRGPIYHPFFFVFFSGAIYWHSDQKYVWWAMGLNFSNVFGVRRMAWLLITIKDVWWVSWVGEITQGFTIYIKRIVEQEVVRAIEAAWEGFFIENLGTDKEVWPRRRHSWQLVSSKKCPTNVMIFFSTFTT